MSSEDQLRAIETALNRAVRNLLAESEVDEPNQSWHSESRRIRGKPSAVSRGPRGITPGRGRRALNGRARVALGMPAGEGSDGTASAPFWPRILATVPSWPESNRREYAWLRRPAAGLSAVIAFVARNAGLETEPACSRLPGRYHSARCDEVIERAPEGSLWDFGPHPPMDVALGRVREALEVLEDERTQPVRMNTRERRERVEPGFTQKCRGHEVARGLRAARLLDEPPRQEPPEPGRRAEASGSSSSPASSDAEILSVCAMSPKEMRSRCVSW